MLALAITFITSALVFYTIGVWSENKQGELKIRHLVMFLTGLLFDTLGTAVMTAIANDGFRFNFHGITGLLAIALMLFHAIWALFVLVKKDGPMKRKFHKFSVFVWTIWLVPFVSGALFGMMR